jgi:hypothetical protein
MNWIKTIKIKQFLLKDIDCHDLDKIQEISSNILRELIKHDEYKYQRTLIVHMNNIKDSDLFSAEEYLNKLLNKVYDIADENRIWID